MLIYSPACSICLFSWYGLLIMVSGAGGVGGDFSQTRIDLHRKKRRCVDVPMRVLYGPNQKMSQHYWYKLCRLWLRSLLLCLSDEWLRDREWDLLCFVFLDFRPLSRSLDPSRELKFKHYQHTASNEWNSFSHRQQIKWRSQHYQTTEHKDRSA